MTGHKCPAIMFKSLFCIGLETLELEVIFSIFVLVSDFWSLCGQLLFYW